MNALTPIKAGEIMEAVIARGDLSKLNAEERAKYYIRVCESIGLNPMTKPFEYITLNGKLTLYATRAAGDQLRKINGISIEVVERRSEDDLFSVHVRAIDASGRRDEDFGVVAFKGLQGEARANAILKAITKAKRRVTLSISGLGFLDETEVADITNAERHPEITPPEPPAATSSSSDVWEDQGATEAAASPPASVQGADGTKKPQANGGTQTPPADLPSAPKPDDGLDIPPALDRRTKRAVSNPGKSPHFLTDRGAFDEKAWEIEVERRAATARDSGELAAIQNEICTPNKVKISEKGWTWQAELIIARLAQLEPADPDALDPAQWLNDLDGALGGVEGSAETLDGIKTRVLLPAKGKVDADSWQRGVALYRAAVAKLTEAV